MTEPQRQRGRAREAAPNGSRGAENDPGADPAANTAAARAGRAVEGAVGRVEAGLRVLRSEDTLRLAIFVAGIAAAVALVVAEFSPLVHIEVLGASCEDLASPQDRDSCNLTGGEDHGYALLIVAGLVAAMSFGAASRRARPAAVALVAAGVVVLLLTLLHSLPTTNETGVVGSNFSQAEANAGRGLWLQLAGGTLAIVAGGLGLRLATRRADAR